MRYDVLGLDPDAMRKAEHGSLDRTVMIWMVGIKRIEKIRTGEIRTIAGVTIISETIK